MKLNLNDAIPEA